MTRFNTLLRLSALAAAGVVAFALPAEKAAAETWEYCVKNLGASEMNFGLNTLPGKYSFVTASATGTPRCGTMLTVDHSANTAVLTGKMKKNTTGALIDVNLRFTGMHHCLGKEMRGWLGDWNDLLGSTPAPLNESALSWQCFDRVSGTFGGSGQALNAPIDNAPAVGAFRMKENPKVDIASFKIASGSKNWLLGFKLYDGKLLDPQNEFEIVGCPAEGTTDNGDPAIPGTDGRKDCVIKWYGDNTFVTTFTNEPDLRGKILVEGRYSILDPRPHCGGDGFPAPGEINYGDYRVTRIPAGGDRPQDGMRITLSPDSGQIEIPWYICGIAPKVAGGKPFLRLINVKADFLSTTGDNANYRDIINSVVQHDTDGGTPGEADGPTNPDYVCNLATTNKDPLIAWLPRADEVPLYTVTSAGIIQKTREIRDVTSGCGSTRGGSSTRSYLLSNLRHLDTLDETQMRGVVAHEIGELDLTLRQPGQCLQADADLKTGLFTNWSADPLAPAYADSRSFLKTLRDDLKAGNDARVVDELQWLLAELGKDGRLYSSFDTCYFKTGKILDLPEYPALEGAYPTYPDLPGYRPRNFRGDLEAQAEHIIWNIEQKLVPLAAP